MKVSQDLVSDVAEVLLSEEQIAAKVAELGQKISSDYEGRELTLVSVLKGSLPFMADLMRRISLPLRIDLMEVSSYGGSATESSGLVRILKDLSAPIEGRDVLLVEDIIDTGLTLNYLHPLPQGQESTLDQDLRVAGQARPTSGRNPDRLRRLRNPGRLRGWIRARLRRGIPKPALRGRAAPRGIRVLGGSQDEQRAKQPRSLDLRDRRDICRRVVLPAVVGDRRWSV